MHPSILEVTFGGLTTIHHRGAAIGAEVFLTKALSSYLALADHQLLPSAGEVVRRPDGNVVAEVYFDRPRVEGENVDLSAMVNALVELLLEAAENV